MFRIRLEPATVIVCGMIICSSMYTTRNINRGHEEFKRRADEMLKKLDDKK